MREYHVGIIGYGFMGKTHTHSYKTIPLYYTNLPFTIRLEGICDTVPGVAEEARCLCSQNRPPRWRCKCASILL